MVSTSLSYVSLAIKFGAVQLPYLVVNCGHLVRMHVCNVNVNDVGLITLLR